MLETPAGCGASSLRMMLLNPAMGDGHRVEREVMVIGRPIAPNFRAADMKILLDKDASASERSFDW